jgi:hypothetical protein
MFVDLVALDVHSVAVQQPCPDRQQQEGENIFGSSFSLEPSCL